MAPWPRPAPPTPLCPPTRERPSTETISANWNETLTFLLGQCEQIQNTANRKKHLEIKKTSSSIWRKVTTHANTVRTSGGGGVDEVSVGWKCKMTTLLYKDFNKDQKYYMSKPPGIKEQRDITSPGTKTFHGDKIRDSKMVLKNKKWLTGGGAKGKSSVRGEYFWINTSELYTLMAWKKKTTQLTFCKSLLCAHCLMNTHIVHSFKLWHKF